MNDDLAEGTTRAMEYPIAGIPWLLVVPAKIDGAYNFPIRSCIAALFVALAPGGAISATEASADQQPTSIFHDELRSGGSGPKLIMIPGGSFNRGGIQQDELPSSNIKISSFAIGAYEITRGEYAKCVEVGACKALESEQDDRLIATLLGEEVPVDASSTARRNGFMPRLSSLARRDDHEDAAFLARSRKVHTSSKVKLLRERAVKELFDHPQVHVSWFDAVRYARWLTSETGNHYRLPSEAEWEFAARAGNTLDGADSAEVARGYANFGSDECCFSGIGGADRWLHTAPVGSFPGNAFGLFDMQGNVWEWVQDCYRTSYSNVLDGRAATGKSCGRVLRGGGWTSTAPMLRVGWRGNGKPYSSQDAIGFRIARDSGGGGGGQFRSSKNHETEMGGVDFEVYVGLLRKEFTTTTDESGKTIEYVVFDLIWMKQQEPAPRKNETTEGVLYIADGKGNRRVALPWTRLWSPAIISPRYYFQKDVGFPVASFGKAERWLREVNPLDMDLEFVPSK